MRHHTKDKGDTGVGFVLAHLLSRGIQVALSLSEHMPFDCIAVSADGELKRLSVKYRAAVKGAVTISRRSSWADSHGSHIRTHVRGDYDAFAVYCPDTGKCYYIRESEIDGISFNIRLKKSKNNQTSRVHLAENYEDPLRLFGSYSSEG